MRGDGGGRKARLHRHAGPGLPAAARRPAGVLPPHSWPGLTPPALGGMREAPQGRPHGLLGADLQPGRTQTPPGAGTQDWGASAPQRGGLCGWGADSGGGAPLGLEVRSSTAWQGPRVGTVGAAAGLGLRPPRLGKGPRAGTQRYMGSEMAGAGPEAPSTSSLPLTLV